MSYGEQISLYFSFFLRMTNISAHLYLGFLIYRLSSHFFLIYFQLPGKGRSFSCRRQKAIQNLLSSWYLPGERERLSSCRLWIGSQLYRQTARPVSVQRKSTFVQVHVSSRYMQGFTGGGLCRGRISTEPGDIWII